MSATTPPDPDPREPDIVEEADLGSFPASDPPPWPGAIAGGPHADEEADGDERDGGTPGSPPGPPSRRP